MEQMNINPLSKKFNISLRGVSEKEISPDLPVIEDKESETPEFDNEDVDMINTETDSTKELNDFESEDEDNA